MWSIFGITLALLAGVSAEDDECVMNAPRYATCEAYSFSNPFPGTPEEIDYACRALTGYAECGIRMDQKCGVDALNLGLANKLLATVNDVCDKNGLLYTVFVDNVQCVKEYFESPAIKECSRTPLEEEKVEKYVEALVEHGLMDSDDKFNKKRCIPFVITLACFSLKMEEKCGELAMEAFNEILSKTTFVFAIDCEEEVREFLPTFMRLNKSEENNEELENVLEKK